MRRRALAALVPFALAISLPGSSGALPAPERQASYAGPAPRAPQVLTERALARLDREGTSALWVFFTDKGEGGARGFERAVRAAGDRIAPAARARRTRESGGRFIPDYYDVPVFNRYVDAVRSAGVTVRHVSKWLNAVSVEGDAAAARRIADLPFVSVVTPVARSRAARPVETSPPITELAAPRLETPEEASSLVHRASTWLAPPAAGYGAAATQLVGVNAIAAMDSGYTASGVIVAMFDTGYNKAHSAVVQLKRLAERDFIFNDGETANQIGDVGSQWDHGTGTWSVLGGYWSGNLVGPAYNATFLLAKTEDARSETPVEEDYWEAAAEWADSIGADVISSSLAYLDFDAPNPDYTYADLNGNTTVITKAATLAARRGILVANAMGNFGPVGASIWAPADADSIVSVGAVDNANAIANFSSRGPTFDGRGKPEVVAQGVGTIWAIAGNNNLISGASGTSLSTPLVGGVAAQIREAHPEWTVQQIRHALKTTADRSGAPDSTTYGWGRINAVSAIYTSPLGPPVFPKPFNLLAPTNNATVVNTSVDFQWAQAVDLDGDPVTYRLVIRSVTPDSMIFEATTPSTMIGYTGYLGPSKQYEWYVEASDPASHTRQSRDRYRFTTSATTAVEGSGSPPAVPFAALGQNRPNPVVSVTEIPFQVSGAPSGSAVPVTLRIFDAGGRLVRTLIDGPEWAPLGRAVRWDGRDQNSRRVASGIYYYQLTASGKVFSKRMVVLR